MISGFSSIFTGFNFIVTIHKLRAPGLTWWRLPIFVWTIYATSLIFLLAVPVLAMAVILVILERLMHIGIAMQQLGDIAERGFGFAPLGADGRGGNQVDGQGNTVDDPAIQFA